MDIQTSLIYVGVVGVCAVVVFAVSMFGIKEKTYDEAIAEQRQMPSDLLLARSKEKNKEKKQKKAGGKKVKEKYVEPQRDSSEGVEEPDSGNEKHHVEFEPEEEILNSQPPQDEKKSKKKRMKPILMNKSEHNVVFVDTPVLANHFEESLPKDDLLLKRQLSREDLKLKSTSKPDKVSALKTEKVISSREVKAAEKPKPDIVVVEKAVEASAVTAETVVPQMVVKEQRTTRKKKSELATLQQMTGDREGINVSVIVPLVQKAELSRSEIQILIDLLLNKQQCSAATNSEWSEGRQDPIVKLKKQLAEKEKALSDEQEAAQAFQNKLKELRTELNMERSRWRQLEDGIAAKQLELQHVTTRLQNAQEAHKTDKSNLTQQLQQLQSQLSEERSRMRKVQDEQGQLKQQLELHMAHLADQHNESETVLKGQLNQLHNQLQEVESVNVALRNEVQNVAEMKMYRDQVGHLNTQLLHHESVARDLGHAKSQLEHRESQLDYENGKLRKELDALNYAYAKCVEEASRWQADRDGGAEERERLVTQLSGLTRDCRQLREENDFLAAQVAAATERPAAEGRENGDAAYAEKPVVKEDSAKLESIVVQKEAQVQDLTSQINTYKTELSKLNADLEAQRTKNNELRTRNWKAMEALSAAEKSLETQVKDSKILVDNASSASRLEEQTATKQVLVRLFPEVKVAAVEPHTSWLEHFVSAAMQDNSSEKQVEQLQSAVAHYKTIILDTEVLLTKLQKSAEEEEIKWREKLLLQDAELEVVKEERDRLADSLEKVTGAHEHGVTEKHIAVTTNGASMDTSISEKPSQSSSVKRRRFAGWFRKKVASKKKKLNTTI